MCGIFGAVNTNGIFAREAFERFSALNDLTSYRGPNDHGVYALMLKKPKEQVTDDCFDVFLGNRRLSIIDLSSNGHQPMTDGQGRWITYNGEIFNYVEVRRELQAKGHKFATETDTEVILHVYSEYGEQGFNKLNGMWAFAIADIPNRRVVLSRDRFSIKPLYLLSLPNCIYFASEIKQLLSLLPERSLNKNIMSAFITQGLLDHSRETFYEGIIKAAPRTNIVITLDTGKIEEVAYWNFSYSTANTSLEEAASQFRELFLDSIKLRLRSDVKVGVLLSGGLDSSTIAVGSRLISGDQVESYSIISEDGICDEHQHINILAETGLKNRKITFTCGDVLRDLDKVLDHNDEPVGGFSVVAQYKLFSAIKQETDVTVLLSGQGGDEVLLGYLKFFFFHLKMLCLQRRYAQAIFQFGASLWQRTVMSQFTLPSARRYIPTLGIGFGRAFKPGYVRVPIWTCNDIASRQVDDIEMYSVPALTHYEDRNSMAHSLEVRHPFLDHRLVELLLNVPPEWKIRNGWTKYLLRRAFPELPDAIRWRRDKQGFLTPEQKWLRHDLEHLIRRTFKNSELSRLGILNDREFLNYYDRFQRGEAVSESDIARTLIAERWMRRAFSENHDS